MEFPALQGAGWPVGAAGRGPGAIVASMLFVQRIHNGAQVAEFGLALCAAIVVRAFVKQG